MQYDDGILNHLKDLDILVFSMSIPGKNNIPLLCKPHKWEFPELKGFRDIYASFIGKITHSLREDLMKVKGTPGWSLSSGKHDLIDYCQMLASSVFTLCPRGYGRTSFRIAEAVQYGSIPVYISDEFVLPEYLHFTDYGVLITPEQLPNLREILAAIPLEEIARKQKALKEVSRWYTYEGTKNHILKTI